MEVNSRKKVLKLITKMKWTHWAIIIGIVAFLFFPSLAVAFLLGAAAVAFYAMLRKKRA